MPKLTKTPGVSLTQKIAGGTWYVVFTDPRTQKQNRRSTKTADGDTATRIAGELSSIIQDPHQWPNPRVGLHEMTYVLWDVRPLGSVVDEAKSMLPSKSDILFKFVKERPPGVNMYNVAAKVNEKYRTVEDVRKALEQIDTLTTDRDRWRERATLAEGQLKKMGARILKSKDAMSTSLKKAQDDWADKSRARGKDKHYIEQLIYDVKRFVTHFKEDSTLGDIIGRESEIDAWLQSLGVGAKRRVEIRRAVLRFLEDSGVDVNRRAVERPGKSDIRADRGAIRWLSKKEARKLADKLSGDWADMFRVQVGTGLRPSELITLKAGDFSGDMSTLTLSPLDKLTLKEGSRTIRVPKEVQAIVKRRLKKNDVLFTYNEKPWQSEDFFYRCYRNALAEAAKLAGIKTQMDCRIGRRTCATLLLADGVPVKTVADILGNSPDMIIEHYGAAIPEHLDPSAAAI